MDSVYDLNTEERTYTFAEDTSGHDDRKLYDSKGYGYSLQNKSTADESSIWICRKMCDKWYCKGKVKITSDKKLIVMRNHNHQPEQTARTSLNTINNSNNASKEICFKSQDIESKTYKYVLKHVPHKKSLKLYESRGYDYALKFQDAIGNSRWRCEHIHKNKHCPGQVCIILQDNHCLSILTEHFHTPFSTPDKFYEMYESVDEVYDTFSPRTNSHSEDHDIVYRFTCVEKNMIVVKEEDYHALAIKREKSDDFQIKKEESPNTILESNEEMRADMSLPTTNTTPQSYKKSVKNVLFKFIKHNNFPDQFLLCDSNGYAYDNIGTFVIEGVSIQQVYCCQEIYHENMRCEAELCEGLNNTIIITKNHNHNPKPKMIKYLENENIFGEFIVNDQKRKIKGTPGRKRKKPRN